MKQLFEEVWKKFLTEGRQLKIWRAVPASTATIRKGDYVTLTQKLAEENAVTSAIYNGTPFQVVWVYVPFEKVKEALNPGEYLYVGNPIEGRPFQISDEHGDVQLVGKD